MSELSWLDYWGLKYDPFMDFPIRSPEHRKFMVVTKSIKKIRPEVQTIANSPVGVIKPVVGTRGSGKSTWLLNFLYSLEDNKTIFFIYVNTFKSISTVREAAKTVFMERYVLNEVISQIFAKIRSIAPSLFEDHKWMEEVAGNIVTIPSPEVRPNISQDNLVDVLKVLKGEKFVKFVIAIDELDKVTEEGAPDYEKLMTMIGDFFGTQQGLFQMLAAEHKASIYISCDEKWMELFRRRNLTYLKKAVQIERLNPLELKRIIKTRLKPQIDIFPFSTESLEIVNSYFSGNARSLIFACRELMIDSSVRGLKQIDGKMVKRLFSKIAAESFQEDFQDIAKLDISSIGAKMLWRLCSKIPMREDREKTLLFLARVYRNEEIELPPEYIVKILKDYEYVTFKLPKGKPEINMKLKSFFDQWIKKGHLLDDLVEWYSENIQRPEEFASIDDKVNSLLKAIPNEQVQKRILYAYDLYSYTLDYHTQKQMVVLKSWSMLESLIKAYCLEIGFREFYLTLSEEQLDEHSSPYHKNRLSLLQKFTIALNKKSTRLIHLGTIKSIKDLRNSVEHEGYMPKEDEATMAKANAKVAFEEIVSKWKVGQKLYVPKRPR